jgi:uncharacterized SAM-binding protein YcdF (DUF218 family)
MSLHRGRRLGISLLIVAFAWALGLVAFLSVASRDPPLPLHADGIVALTGGAERVETALHLLAEGRANWLLLSGIGGGAELAGFAQRAGVQAAPLAARVALGRQATSTRGNAEETAVWVQAKDIRSLIVVTAWYHMPRALTELHRALPGVVLYPAPVQPEGTRQVDVALVRLLLAEYTKLLAARLDLTALVPARAAVTAPGVRPG